MYKLSRRIGKITSSPTLAITGKAKQMQKEGIKVISLAAGEPDFDTPDYIKEAAIEALKGGFTKYTQVSGTVELRKVIAEKFRKDNGLSYNPDEIIVSCGAKHTLYNLMQVLCDDGDEVIIFSPYWVSYPEQIKLAGGKPIIIPTVEEKSFKLSIKLLEEAVTEKAKILILNSPANPTGTVYTKEELEEISGFCRENNLWVISDEIYEKIIYDGIKHCSIAALGKEIKDRTIVVNGFSKSYAMTGWRIGYAAGPKEIIEAMANLQSQSTSNPTSFAQKAAETALNAGEGDESISLMVNAFCRRRNFLIEEIDKWERIHFIVPKGSFYLFLNVSEYYGNSYKGEIIKSSVQFSQYLLEGFQVAVVPGSAFGDDYYIRLSFANSLENIAEALKRIKEFLKQLS